MTANGSNQGGGAGLLVALLAVAAGGGLIGFLFGRANAEREAREAKERSPAILREQDLEANQGPFVCGRIVTDIRARRVVCGSRDPRGPWFSPDAYPDPASTQDALALPPDNCASTAVDVTVPAGTPVCVGVARPAFGRPGGGRQYLIREYDRVQFD